MIVSGHKAFWTKERFWLCFQALALLAGALIVQSLADRYVSATQGLAVNDLFAAHLPQINLDFFVVQGALILAVIVVGLLLAKPKYLPFTVKAFAFFLIIRSFFVVLTHLGSQPEEIQLDPQMIGFTLYKWLFHTKGDFFFSGHTGMPFLMSLVFWPERKWRVFFLVSTFVMGLSMLFGRLHYSIDVFAAPFMTYSIYIIVTKLFPKDFALTENQI